MNADLNTLLPKFALIVSVLCTSYSAMGQVEETADPTPAAEGTAEQSEAAVEEAEQQNGATGATDVMNGTVSEAKVNHPDRGFIYSIGTNFDFIGGLGTENLYHDIRVNLPNIGTQHAKNKCGSFGMELSFDRFRTTSQVDSSTRTYRQVTPQVDITETDTTVRPVFRTYNSNEKVTTYYDIIGAGINPYWALSKPRDDWFFATGVDIRWQRAVYIRTTERLIVDSVSLTAPSSWPRPYELDPVVPPTNDRSRLTQDNFYVGLSLRSSMAVAGGIANIRLSGGFVYSMELNDGSNQLLPRTGGFYAVNVEFIEPVVAGVKLGAELRGFTEYGPKEASRYQPRFNLFLAKEIKWEKIGQFLKP